MLVQPPSVSSQSSVRATTLTRARQGPSVSPYVISEEVFKGVAIRERRRTDRSNQPFVLLLVSANGDASEIPSPIWGTVIDALAAAKRQSDILGWFRLRSIIGLISTEIQTFNAPAVRTIEARVRRELAGRLNPEVLSRLSVRLYVQQASSDGGGAHTEGESVPPADPILTQLCSLDTRPAYRDAVKRTLDIFGSVVLLMALSPMFFFIAIVVRLTSPGPSFFRQVRVGEMAKSFTMLKFRTMRVDADHGLHQEFVTNLINSAPIDRAANTGLFKIANDPRVTPVGHLLRRTSLDELPQLWNVLRGDMSLVGPRPPLQYEFRQYRLWHRRRVLEAKPGLTGLWQVTGRSRTTFDQMVRLDLRYARARCLWLDIKILLATPAVVISGKGAC
jgi:lipopolysaccharide/colanic/teichoic acid biosynthesis glycosyltransferase